MIFSEKDHTLSNLTRLAPGLERGPQATIKTKLIDRRRGIDGADAAKLDAGPLKAALLQHAARRRIADASPGRKHLMAERGEGVVDQRPRGLGGVAATPKGDAQPVAELSAVLPRVKAAHSDQRAVKLDRKYGLAARLIDRGDKSCGIRGGIGMRKTRGVLGNAAVTGQSHHCRHVAAQRRAQRQPRGFERGNAARLGV